MKYGLILKIIIGTILAGAGIAAVVQGEIISRGSNVPTEPVIGLFAGIIMFGGVIALICAAAVLLWALGGLRRNKIARVVARVIAFSAGFVSTVTGLAFAEESYYSISGCIQAHAHGYEHSPSWDCVIFVGLTLFFFALAVIFFTKALKRNNKHKEGGHIETDNVLHASNGEKPIKPPK